MINSRYKKIGLWLALIGAVIGTLLKIGYLPGAGFLLFFLLPIGLFLMTFSKEKIEDERVEVYRSVAFRKSIIMTAFCYFIYYYVVVFSGNVVPFSDQSGLIVIILQLVIYTVIFNKSLDRG